MSPAVEKGLLWSEKSGIFGRTGAPSEAMMLKRSSPKEGLSERGSPASGAILCKDNQNVTNFHTVTYKPLSVDITFRKRM